MLSFVSPRAHGHLVGRSLILLLSTLLLAVGCQSAGDEPTGSSADLAQADSAKAIGQAIDEQAEAPLTLMTALAAVAAEHALPLVGAAIQNDDEAVEREALAALQTALAPIRASYRDGAPLWDALVLFAGPDGLLNFGDVKATFECSDPAELAKILDYALETGIAAADGFKKQALVGLRERIAKNQPLPKPPTATPLFDFFSSDPAVRRAAIDGEINRRLVDTLARECQAPVSEVTQRGAFDLLRTYCPAALDMRAQGILMGVFGLRNVEASRDAGGSCEGRKLTQARVAALVERFGGSSTPKSKTAPIVDFARVQVSKYFGPQAVSTTGKVESARGIGAFADAIVPAKLRLEPVLEGGVPVRRLRALLDAMLTDEGLDGAAVFERAKALGDFGQCAEQGIVYAGKRNERRVKSSIGDYPNEAVVRALFDPRVEEGVARSTLEAFAKAEGKSTEDLIREAESNKRGAVFGKAGSSDGTFVYQAVSGIDFWGHSSYLARQEFQTRSDGTVTITRIEVEQEVDGEFTVTLIEPTQDGYIEATFDGYAISKPRPDGATRPCLRASR